jgi:type IV fimbrial biogenesis protein FimT
MGLPMRLRNPSRKSGFTLIELMVTLAVAAILLVVAVPSFVEFIDKARLKGVADGVVDFVNDARVESVKQGTDVAVAFGGTITAWCVGANAAVISTANPGDAVIPAAIPCDCSTASSCTIGGQQKAFETASIKGVELSAIPASVTFDSRLGTVKSLGTTTATLSSPQKMFDLRLTVSPLGHVGLCVPTGSRAISGYSSC